MWEQYWYNNIADLQNNVCSRLVQSDQTNKSIQALEYIHSLQQTIFSETLQSNKYDELFSKMHYRSECSKLTTSNAVTSQYIEPLIGLLRDPLTMCSISKLSRTPSIPNVEPIQSKRFFLLGPSAPYQNYQSPIPAIAPWLYQKGSQKILFDLGCSYFNGGSDPNSVTSTIGARWFYEYFRSKSLSFDRIIAFEAENYPPGTYWKQIPDDLTGILTFINNGVEKTGKFNPWDILKRIAKIDDYVIIKLDIDTPELETFLINQVLTDKTISSLIDEMFFEMHITVNEMKGYWGSPPGELKDSYVLFTKLRQLGIRMHSWP